MSYDLSRAVERAVGDLRRIAADLRRSPCPGEDRVAYEQRVAERLDQIAASLERPRVVADEEDMPLLGDVPAWLLEMQGEEPPLPRPPLLGM